MKRNEWMKRGLEAVLAVALTGAGGQAAHASTGPDLKIGAVQVLELTHQVVIEVSNEGGSPSRGCDVWLPELAARLQARHLGSPFPLRAHVPGLPPGGQARVVLDDLRLGWQPEGLLVQVDLFDRVREVNEQNNTVRVVPSYR